MVGADDPAGLKSSQGLGDDIEVEGQAPADVVRGQRFAEALQEVQDRLARDEVSSLGLGKLVSIGIPISGWLAVAVTGAGRGARNQL